MVAPATRKPSKGVIATRFRPKRASSFERLPRPEQTKVQVQPTDPGHTSGRPVTGCHTESHPHGWLSRFWTPFHPPATPPRPPPKTPGALISTFFIPRSASNYLSDLTSGSSINFAYRAADATPVSARLAAILESQGICRVLCSAVACVAGTETPRLRRLNRH
jgi:hypothetical protein